MKRALMLLISLWLIVPCRATNDVWEQAAIPDHWQVALTAKFKELATLPTLHERVAGTTGFLLEHLLPSSIPLPEQVALVHHIRAGVADQLEHEQETLRESINIAQEMNHAGEQLLRRSQQQWAFLVALHQTVATTLLNDQEHLASAHHRISMMVTNVEGVLGQVLAEQASFQAADQQRQRLISNRRRRLARDRKVGAVVIGGVVCAALGVAGLAALVRMRPAQTGNNQLVLGSSVSRRMDELEATHGVAYVGAPVESDKLQKYIESKYKVKLPIERDKKASATTSDASSNTPSPPKGILKSTSEAAAQTLPRKKVSFGTATQAPVPAQEVHNHVHHHTHEHKYVHYVKEGEKDEGGESAMDKRRGVPSKGEGLAEGKFLKPEAPEKQDTLSCNVGGEPEKINITSEEDFRKSRKMPSNVTKEAHRLVD